MGETFKLKFLNDGTGERLIDEPFGYSEISFNLEQNENGLARDNSFNGGSLELTFTTERDHYLDLLLYYFDRYGSEAKISFIISIDGIDNIIGDLDFVNAKTDELEYFSCKVIESNDFQIMKRRKDAEVDMFSNKTLDKEYIEPVKTYNILVKAKADVVESRWEQQSEYSKEWETSFFGVNIVSIVPFNALKTEEIKSSAGSLDIDDSVKEFENNKYRWGSGKDLWIIKATDNLKNLKFKISDSFNLKIKTSHSAYQYVSGHVNFNLMIRKGVDIQNSIAVSLITKRIEDNQEFNHNGGFEFSIDSLDRGQFLWLMVELDIYNNTNIGYYGKNIANVYIKDMNVEASAESLAYNSITKGVRLIDSIKQVTKSVSGLNVVAPDFDSEGKLYDNFLLNGSLLRRKTDIPFNLSLKTISEGLKEFNADYEVNKNVFFGLEKDFYRDEECYFFDNVQFSEFTKVINQKTAINIFEYKYNKHQSLKEKEQPNSSDTVHGSMKLLLANKMCENSRMIDVGWIRDSFLLDEARKKAYEISNDTSYQNDSDTFILDCVKNDKDLEFIETTELYHEWSGITNKLLLRSKDELNFIIVGIEPNTTFEIFNDLNAGTYNVESVASQQLTLILINGGAMQSANDGKRYTKYKYLLKKEQVNYISRTDEGLVGNNIKSLESFANLRYSVKRNVLNFYGSYLATCNIANLGKEIAVNEYLHNGECEIELDGLKFKENAPFSPTDPILSPFSYENVVFSNVSMKEYIELKKEIRTKRGYIRTINKNGFPIKIYPKKMSYIKATEELTISEAEEKHELDYIDIIVDNTYVTFNGNIKLLKKGWTDYKGWEIKNNMVSLFDRRGFRYFKPVYWHKITINGYKSQEINDFENRMKLIN